MSEEISVPTQTPITKKTGFRGPHDENGRSLWAWKPGQSGNPSGRPKKQPITEAYLKLLTPAQAKKLARKALEKAAAGSIAHLVEITDRVEGPVVRETRVSGTVAHEITEKERSQAIETLQLIESIDSEQAIDAEYVSPTESDTSKE